MNLSQDHIYEVQAAMEQWTDARVIDSVDLENLLLFLLYVPKTLSQFGWRFHGFSTRQRNGQTLLTLKASENGTPLVVFLTANDTIGCMHRFLDLLESDRLNWVKDRYPPI